MRNNKGFTLIETMAVITIMAVIVTLAVPNFRNMQANNRVMGVANELASALRQGRSEALVQRRNLRFAAISGKTGYQSKNNWGEQGWQVISPDGTQSFLEQRKLPSTIIVSSMGTRLAPSQLFFVAATGMVSLSGVTPYQPVTIVFSVCDKNASRGMDVLMSPLGRVIVQRHSSAATCTALRS